jgi:hypothetical protein
MVSGNLLFNSSWQSHEYSSYFSLFFSIILTFLYFFAYFLLPLEMHVLSVPDCANIYEVTLIRHVLTKGEKLYEIEHMCKKLRRFHYIWSECA